MTVSSVWTTAWLLLFSLIFNHTLAQDVSSIPQCGQNCFQVAFNEFSRSCPNRDAACLCSQPGFNTEITSCTGQQCVSTTDNSTTLTFLRSYCAAASQNVTATTVTPTTSISSTSSNNSSSSVTTTPYPISNTTQSTSTGSITSTGSATTGSGPITSTVVVSGTTATATSANTRTGTSTATPSPSLSQGLGVKPGSDSRVVLAAMVASLLFVAFPI